MTKKKIFPIVLILLGVAFVLGAFFSWFDNSTTQSVGLGKWVFDVLQFLVGAGAGIGGWLSLRKGKSEVSGSNQRVQETMDSPDSEQIMEGKGSSQKQKSVRSPRSKQSMK